MVMARAPVARATSGAVRAPRSSWMLALLAHETRSQAAGDTSRLSLLAGAVTAARYRSFLGQVYCFEAPIESAIARTADLDLRPLEAHLKVPHLEADLEALGIRTRPVGAPSTLGFESAADALGWLYVLQRNTLLHGQLHRHLERRLPAEARLAGRYLSALEGTAGAQLRALGAMLDATARQTRTADRIVAAAKEAWRCQRQWFECAVVPSRSDCRRTVAESRIVNPAQNG